MQQKEMTVSSPASVQARYIGRNKTWNDGRA